MRAIVIGAGFGGIAAALRLRAKGYEVLVLDRCNQIGGRAQVFQVDGFRHDAGPTVITDPDCLAQLWRLSGHDMAQDVTLLPVTPVLQRIVCFGDPSPDGLEALMARQEQATAQQEAAAREVDERFGELMNGTVADPRAQLGVCYRRFAADQRGRFAVDALRGNADRVGIRGRAVGTDRNRVDWWARVPF